MLMCKIDALRANERLIKSLPLLDETKEWVLSEIKEDNIRERALLELRNLKTQIKLAINFIKVIVRESTTPQEEDKRRNALREFKSRFDELLQNIDERSIRTLKKEFSSLDREESERRLESEIAELKRKILSDAVLKSASVTFQQGYRHFDSGKSLQHPCHSVITIRRFYKCEIQGKFYLIETKIPWSKPILDIQTRGIPDNTPYRGFFIETSIEMIVKILNDHGHNEIDPNSLRSLSGTLINNALEEACNQELEHLLMVCS